MGARIVSSGFIGHVMSLQPLPLGNDVSAPDAQPLVNQLRGLRFTQQTERTNMTDPDARLFVWLYTATEVRGTDRDLAARRLIWLYTSPEIRGKKVL